jgi:hypothetical protein
VRITECGWIGIKINNPTRETADRQGSPLVRSTAPGTVIACAMLDRTTDHATGPKTTKAAKQRRYRIRRKHGIMVLPDVEADIRVLDMLVRVGAITEDDANSGDATRIGQAISRWFARSS